MVKAKLLALLVVVGLGIYYIPRFVAAVRYAFDYTPDPTEVDSRARALQSAPPRAPDPREVAAEEWLTQNGRGRFLAASSAPDWANGTRLHVRASGDNYLFYFGRSGCIHGVWTQSPREQIFRGEACE